MKYVYKFKLNSSFKRTVYCNQRAINLRLHKISFKKTQYQEFFFNQSTMNSVTWKVLNIQLLDQILINIFQVVSSYLALTGFLDHLILLTLAFKFSLFLAFFYWTIPFKSIISEHWSLVLFVLDCIQLYRKYDGFWS